MRFLTPLALLFTFLAAGTFGCQSHHEEGVTSDYHSQWTNVNADTKTTTDAAQAVLNDMGLRNVSGSSTNVDGKAVGKKSDGTDVKVAVQKAEGGKASQV